MLCRLAVLVCLIAGGDPLRAQEILLSESSPGREFTGNVRVDLFSSPTMTGTLPQDKAGEGTSPGLHKSPWLAGGMSLAVPGSGEFYAGSYWKAALFLAVEVGAWAMAYHFDKKGDRQTDFFQNYADQHWSVIQYAQYSLKNFIPASEQPAYQQGLFYPNSQGRPPWEQVNWDVLRQMEQEIGGFYSHNLPPHGEQQYYELIGKYPQFVSGWDAVRDNPLPPDYEQIKANLPQQYLEYGTWRGTANDYYRSASTYVAVAVVNHIVSAIDAAWTAGSYNRAHVEAMVQPIPGPGGLVMVPAMKVEYRF
jgi:hypothetical protein